MPVQVTINTLLEDSRSFQALYDTTAEQFDVPFWRRFLTEEFTSQLDWRALEAVSSKAPAASIIDYSGAKPERKPVALSQISGEIATFGNSYTFNKRDNRKIRDIELNIGRFGIDASRLVDFIYPHLKRLAIGPHKSVDMLLLEALSNGTMSVDNTNNPDGEVFTLDWEPSREDVTTVWTDSAATPLEDIRAVVQAGMAKGITYTRMLMSLTTFNNMIGTTQFKNQFSLTVASQGGQIETPTLPFLTESQVNVFFTAAGLPAIEIINEPIDIEKNDGTVSTIFPFADHRVTFLTSDVAGTLMYTYAEEEQEPDPSKTYATTDNVLVSTKTQDGKRIFESEFNSFPVLNTVNNMVVLRTNVTS